MKVLVSGSTGLVGKALVARLGEAGDEAQGLVRQPRGPREIGWDPARGGLPSARLEGFEAVVHLAGEGIAEGRWTRAKMQRIRDSRVHGTRLFASGLAGLERRPRVLVCASAIGFYGDRGDERLDESSGAGHGFLADVCREWEAACEPAREAGIRVVNLRIGVVLSRDGGALAKMLFPFRLGLGGRIGSGRQWMSWIELADLVGAIRHAVATDSLSGPVNAVSPQPVTNAEFTRTLGSVLSRPTIFPLPAFAARLVLGKMADELLLASMHVQPSALEGSGFRFEHPGLESALRSALGKDAS